MPYLVQILSYLWEIKLAQQQGFLRLYFNLLSVPLTALKVLVQDSVC